MAWARWTSIVAWVYACLGACIGAWICACTPAVSTAAAPTTSPSTAVRRARPRERPAIPADALPASAWRADLRQLIDTIEAVHPNPYHDVDRDRVHAELDRISASDKPKTPRQLYHDVARLAALLQEGHTFVWLPDVDLAPRALSEPMAFPLEVEITADDELRITADDAEAGVGAGEVIVRIGERPMAELVERWRSETSGETTAYRNAVIIRRLTTRMWLEDIEAPFALVVRGRDGTERAVTVAGLTLDQVRARSASVTEAGPWSLRIEDRIAVLDLRSMSDPEGFESFARDMFTRLRKEKVRGLIVDVRANSGGDSRVADTLLRYVTDRPYRLGARKEWKASALMQEAVREQPWGQVLVEATTGDIVEIDVPVATPPAEALRFRGPVCVLVGPYTYSSAIMLANAIQDFDLATLVGHRTGGRPNTYGEVYDFKLAHSGLRIGTSSARFVRANGDGEDDGPVIPHIELPEGASADETMAAARASILERRRVKTTGR